MQNGALRVLKGYLWFIAAFHLFVGIAINVSQRATEAIARGYGARVDWTPQFVYILHPLGAFMIALGLVAIAAAREPLRYSGVVLGFVILFAIRALHRVVYGDVLANVFSIAPRRNTANLVIMAGQAVLLFLLWRAARTAEPRAA